ncbi:hypothetical protein D9757_000040 [Collybiopsis confluens]|uniref:Uncharacterized protein n=1 Tax=Collybiopsis confluens TaxID=2823264 RepID=A0A8H5I261_9AGAR|nr:hypothetical protein D9757_000040 [Collybiopsis confluens]
MALRLFSFFALLATAQAQSVPALQWLNFTNLLQGSAKPGPLKDAAIGYDSTSSTIIVFGGESSGGIAQSQTYLLNTQTMTWSIPTPPATALTTPPPRSASVSGNDFAASNRHGFIVVGGKDINNRSLSDVWEYDYVQQFWSEVTISPSDVGPSPRWGAAGGKDPRTSAVADPILPGPNNTFYYTGGFDGTSLQPLSDLAKITIQNANALSNQALSSAAVIDSVAIYGGCSITSATNSSCATQNAYVLNTDSKNSVSPNPCPAPRLGAAMTQNLNSVSSTATQAMLLLGTFNVSSWSDDSGLENGEVVFWDLDAGTWIRTVPSGDPGSAGSRIAFPSPREGSAIFSSATPVFGSSTGNYSETLVYGGRDASGAYLNELWVLRAYNGAVSPSQPKWSGFGDGVLKTGVDADGTGVQVQFLSTCASSISPTNPSPSSGGSPTASPKPTGSSGSAAKNIASDDTSISHKVLAPLSLALLFSGLLLGRAFSPFFNDGPFTQKTSAFSSLVLLIWFGSGIAGLVLAFISISSATALGQQSPSGLHLKTNHGRAALTLFVILYAVVPVIWLLSRHAEHPRKQVIKGESSEIAPSDKQQTTSVDTAEKLRSVQSRSRTPSRPSSPRQRTHSWGPSILWRPSIDRRLSSDADSNTSSEHQSAVASADPPRSFEVLNRPPRMRRIHAVNTDRTQVGSLRDIDWLQRRRSLTAFGELDYALTQAQRVHERELNSTPATTDQLNSVPLIRSSPRMPGPITFVFHLLLHLSMLGLAIVSLIILWSHSLAGFIVFLIWIIAHYAGLFILAWNGLPTISILAVILMRLRTNPDLQPPQELAEYIASQSPAVSAPDHYAFPTQGPYSHEPPFLTAGSTDFSHGGPRSAETDGDDEEEDEDARQQRIEGEMERREIVTVTMPRRKLLIANPS